MSMSASGIYVPPLIIFPRVRAPKNVNIIEKAPLGTIASYHPSGWMQADIFLKWFDHFLSFVMPSKKRPVLLLLDGHATHTKNMEFIMKPRENYATVICFPPHCSHRLQPLDVSFMAPFSSNYLNEVRIWLRTHPRVVTEYQIPELFGIAYMKSANMLTAVNYFRKTGISPLDREVFDDWMFEPSETTNRSFPEMDSATSNLTTKSQTQIISLQELSLTSCSESETLSSTSMASFTIASPAEIVSISNEKTQQTRK
ncbi:uncharacterized protein LOC136089198 [Hydra vulgaris]|uniref:Uncharacterized protein LOC136089198 n=1 Tax=Hydra vulgaris TaxID=6087 RepID=A0ABM4D9H7_HYDVU